MELTRGEPGSGPGGNNPDGTNQHEKQAEEVNRDDVTVNLSTGQPAQPTSERDYAREAPTGNSVSYALRRLKRERPDLYEQVRAGAKSAHGAMVEAGAFDAIRAPAYP